MGMAETECRQRGSALLHARNIQATKESICKAMSRRRSCRQNVARCVDETCVIKRICQWNSVRWTDCYCCRVMQAHQKKFASRVVFLISFVCENNEIGSWLRILRLKLFIWRLAGLHNAAHISSASLKCLAELGNNFFICRHPHLPSKLGRSQGN